MKPAALSVLKLRAYTAAEVSELLDVSVQTVRDMVAAGVLRGFTRTSYPRPPGSPHAFKRTRLYVSGKEIERYLDAMADDYERRRSAARARRASRS